MPVEKIGLPAWEARRKAWTEPNQAYLDKRKDAEILTAKYDISFKLEGHRKIVYEQLVRQHRILKEPMPLRHIVSLLIE